MQNLTESHIRKIVKEILSETLILEISTKEKTKIMSKSNERVPFSSELMKQAILQGREIGILFKTDNDKTRMPVAKYRIIHPVALGIDRNGRLVYRGLHITGQSEKAAISTGSRSAEVEAEKDGMNAWRLFRVDNTRSMWFTGRFFSDNIPGFNPNDRAMTSILAVYNPTVAKQYQNSLINKTPIETPKYKDNNKIDKDFDQLGYEDKPIREKNKIRSFFK